jgi:hypothetical protein
VDERLRLKRIAEMICISLLVQYRRAGEMAAIFKRVYDRGKIILVVGIVTF